VTGGVDDEWLRPIDLMVDSDAPAQIALELGRRHALYLREAQRLALEGRVPSEPGLEAGIREETRRYLRSHPWHADASLGPAVLEAEHRALSALKAIVATAAAGPGARDARPGRPVRRLALQPSATIVGNMAVRKRPDGKRLELSWDPVPNVTLWKLRVSVRPDPRGDYVEGELVTLAAEVTSFAVELDEQPRRVQLYGHAQGGRVVRRAVLSALTSGNSGAQLKRQASAG